MTHPGSSFAFALVSVEGGAGGKELHRQGIIHIDWKLEFMSRALDRLLPQFDFLAERFNEQALLSSEGEKLLSSSTVKLTAKVLKSDSFKPSTHMFGALGKVIERYAQLLEICDCHQDLWNQNMQQTACPGLV